MKIPKGEHKTKVKKKKHLFFLKKNKKFYRDEREYRLADLLSNLHPAISKEKSRVQYNEDAAVTDLWISFFLYLSVYEFVTAKHLEDSGFSEFFVKNTLYKIINAGYIERYLPAHLTFEQKYNGPNDARDWGYYEIKPRRSRVLYCLSKEGKRIVENVYDNLYDSVEFLQEDYD